MIEVLI